MTGRTDAIIDLSNVCRDGRLEPAGQANLARYDLIVEACRDLIGPGARLAVVTDNSLMATLSPQDRRRLKELLRDGVATTAPKADLPILRLAAETGAIVITRDNFEDHRKEFSWIADADGRFWDWAILPDGGVTLRERVMPRFTEFDLSRAADQDHLRGQLRLDDSRLEEVLTHRWTCTNRACLSGKFPPQLRPLPSWDGVAYRCVSCGSTVERGEVRPRAIELKFSNSAGEELRPVLEHGASLTVGRESPELDIARLAGEGVDKLSGQHARFEFNGSEWSVTDLGSRNGTWLGAWNYRADTRMDWARLNPHVRTVLTERCAVSLVDIVRVDRSGKLSVRS